MVQQAMRRKCLACGVRPAIRGCFCANCQQKMEADKASRAPEKPWLYAGYRGDILGFFRNGQGVSTPRLLGITAKWKDGTGWIYPVPKSRLINLDTYCPGFSREQIKKLKSAFKAATTPRVPVIRN